VIPWEAIATACSDLLLKEPQIPDKESLHFYEAVNSPSPQPVEKAMASVCLITVDESSWASGILLNDLGLILTNAHLLEPWRFGKTTVNGGKNETESAIGQSVLPKLVNIEPGNVDKSKGRKLSLPYNGQKRIRVRLDHVKPWIWCDARVLYICKGPLDVALMQLEYVPEKLCPIKVDISCPIVGSKAYVIGHGLFAPRCGNSLAFLFAFGLFHFVYECIFLMF